MCNFNSDVVDMIYNGVENNKKEIVILKKASILML